MVTLVIQDQDRYPMSQMPQSIACERFGSLFSLVHDPIGSVSLAMLALRREGVPVGDQHAPTAHKRAILCRDKVELVVVVERMFRPQNLEPLLHRQVRGADENTAREGRSSGIAPAVTERPGDEHSHHDRLAASRRHFAAKASEREKVTVGGGVDEAWEVLAGQFLELGLLTFEETLEVFRGHLEAAESGGAQSARECELEQIDDRLCRFELAEEESVGNPVGVPPVIEEIARDGRCAAVPRLPPAPHVLT